MTILDKDANGTVYRTSNKGFSVKREANRIIELLKDQNIEFDYEIARTGSTYITYEDDLILLEIRISNHTKRINYLEQIPCVVKFDSVGYVQMEITNTDSFSKVFELLSNFENLKKIAEKKVMDFKLSVRKKRLNELCANEPTLCFLQKEARKRNRISELSEKYGELPTKKRRKKFAEGELSDARYKSFLIN